MESMTLDGYLKFVESNIKAKTTYNSRYAKIKNDITSTWYTVKDSSNVVIQIQIPSEKAKHVNYTVILEFPMGTVNDTAKRLLTSEMKVFSNCPSFVFMNAKYFEEKGFLIEWAKSLYDPKVFEETEEMQDSKKEAQAQEKVKDVKCEKSLYFAVMHIRSMTPISILTKLSKARQIKDTATVLKHIKNSNDMLSKRVKNASKHPLNPKKKTTSRDDKTKNSLTKSVGKVKSVPKIKSTKSTKNVSKIKHI